MKNIEFLILIAFVATMFAGAVSGAFATESQQ